MNEVGDNRGNLELIMAVLRKNAYFNEKVAQETALRVMNYFGYSDEIIDNMLDNDDRKLFYFLQDLEILTTRWEEMQLISGRNWRIFYWGLNSKKMRWLLSPDDVVRTKLDIYGSLPDSTWSDHIGPKMDHSKPIYLRNTSTMA